MRRLITRIAVGLAVTAGVITMSSATASARTFDDEVWNQPLRGYGVLHVELNRGPDPFVAASLDGERGVPSWRFQVSLAPWSNSPTH